MNLLEAINISKSFTDVGSNLNILQGLHLEVGVNTTTAITGESGSGKSTLLHILGILDNPDSGKILYEGKERGFFDKDSSAFRNEKIGFVFQHHYLLEEFTACENVAMPFFIKTANWHKSIQTAKELLKRVALYDRKDHLPKQLSGGEQQRVSVARALINTPVMILADEPTGNLDSRHSDEIIELMIELNSKENCSLVIVTHNKNIAERMQHHYVLKEGVLHPTR